MTSNYDVSVGIGDNKILDLTQHWMDEDLPPMTPKQMEDILQNLSSPLRHLGPTNSLSIVYQADGTDYHENPGIASDNGLFNIFGTRSGSLPGSLESSPSKLSKGLSFEDSSGFALIDSRGGSLFTSPEKTSTSRTRGSCSQKLAFTDNKETFFKEVAKALTPEPESNQLAPPELSPDSRIVGGKRKLVEFVDENPTAKRIGEAFATCKKACIPGHKWYSPGTDTEIWKCPHAGCEYICKHRKNLFQHFYGKKGHECIVAGNEHFGVVDGVRVVPRGFSKYKYVCPVVGCGLKYEEKRQLYNHFHDQDGVCDHEIDFSCLCPRSGKRSNSELNIKKATTTYRLTGKVLEVLDREGKACKRETNEKGQFIDSKGRVLQKSGLPEPGQEHSESDSSDESGSERSFDPTIGIKCRI